MLNFSSFVLYRFDWNLKYHSHVWVHLPFQFEQDQYFLSFYFTFSPPSIKKRKEKTRSQRYLKYKIFFFLRENRCFCNRLKCDSAFCKIQLLFLPFHYINVPSIMFHSKKEIFNKKLTEIKRFLLKFSN